MRPMSREEYSALLSQRAHAMAQVKRLNEAILHAKVACSGCREGYLKPGGKMLKDLCPGCAVARGKRGYQPKNADRLGLAIRLYQEGAGITDVRAKTGLSRYWLSMRFREAGILRPAGWPKGRSRSKTNGI